MYAIKFSRSSTRGASISGLAIGLICISALAGNLANAQTSVIRNITQDTERLELTVNTSRILTLEKPIPKMVVNNPEMVTVTALGPKQVQIAARKTGVTQVNFWDEDGKVYSVDICIYGDVQELQLALKRLFPESSVKVVRLTDSLVLEGFVEKPEAVSPIIRLAEDYAPKVVNNITVGGVQQVLLKVKVMEVSRTKLRQLGFDFAQISGSNYVASSISGLLQSVATSTGTASGSGGTVSFGIVDGNNSFFGFLDALQQNNVAKILADPSLVAVSGRPAHFNAGGEFPIVVPSGLGQSTIEWKKFGTQVDFVPIVLGNGNIRLEVRPRVSELDDTRSVTMNTYVVPALRVREVETAVEMKAGQTLALAGLIQTRVEAQHRGLPYISDLPYVGAAFRSMHEEVNEIELLILCTPELVAGLDPHEVPPCGPGMESVSPSNAQLYFNGHLEMPACPPCGPACGPITPCRPRQSCGPVCVSGGMSGCSSCDMTAGGMTIMATDGVNGETVLPIELPQPGANGPIPEPVGPTMGAPQSPGSMSPEMPAVEPMPVDGAKYPTTGRYPAQTSMPQRGNPNHPANPQYQATYQNLPNRNTNTPGLIGPVGYDIEK